LANIQSVADEIVFMGVSSSDPDGFPLVVGIGFPNTQSTKTIFIKPPQEWKLVEVVKELENSEIGALKLNPKTIAGIKTSDLMSKGVDPEEAVETILRYVDGKSIYSMDPKQEKNLIGKLASHLPQTFNLNSAIGLFDSYVSSELERELQLNTKTNLRYYPRNKSDTRWLIELYHRCRQQGRI
jgi:hypothetical protein